ncbi:radical SAM protein [Candidatus Woesearchaeota archaeon]|nr:radical SAM protein [Candidatus Woesearchaeota archaeon]
MEVLLINSPRLFFKNTCFSFTAPPLGISYINGYLHKKGIESRIIDLNILLMENNELMNLFQEIDPNLDFNEFFLKKDKIIKSALDYFFSKIRINCPDNDPAIIGISILEAQSLKIMIPFIEKLKYRYPESKIIVGGNSAPLIEDKYVLNKTIDYIIFKEGEKIFYELIKAIENKRSISGIPSIKYLDNSSIKENKYCGDFDIAGQAIKFNEHDIEKYRFLNRFYESFNDIFVTPVLPYSFSKGCSFKCTFCGAPYDNRKIQHKNTEKIVQDIEFLKQKYKQNYFYFFNQHLTINKSFISELCDRLIDSKTDILWSDSIKPLPYLSQKIYYKLREAGCIMLSHGIETGSEKIMKLMNKGHSVKDNKKNLNYSHKAGIWNMANFMVGFPTETEKEFNETLEFIRKNSEHIDSLFVNKFRLEKNYIRYHPEEFGIMSHGNLELNSISNVMLDEYDEIKGLSYKEIMRLNDKRYNIIHRLIKPEDKYKLDLFSHRMIFPLYDNLIEKEKVREFYRENYNLISRYDKRYYSVFTGAVSNQKIKGNLNYCSAEIFKETPKKDIFEELAKIAEQGYKRLIFTGGEPLIRKDIFEILNKAKKIGFEYIIVKTNARMLQYRSFCKKLSQYVDEILVISPSDNEEEYDSISGIKGSFMQAKQGIENWKNLGKKIRHYSK